MSNYGWPEESNDDASRALIRERDEAIKIVERYYWVQPRKQGQKIDSIARAFLTRLGKLQDSQSKLEPKP